MSSLGPRERPLETSGHDLPPDPAVEALTQLIASEYDLALLQEPALLARSDPGRLWLLWFAIGATFEVCDLLGRDSKNERDALFLHVADLFFRAWSNCSSQPVLRPCRPACGAIGGSATTSQDCGSATTAAPHRC